VVLFLLPAITWAESSEIEPFVIENQSSQPFSYQFHFGYEAKNVAPWTTTETIPSGDRHTISTPVPLMIRFREGDDWKNYKLSPGRFFRFQSDSNNHGDLVLASTVIKPPQILREIKVLAVADTEYREHFPDWQERIRGIISGASRHFENEFAIRFTLTAFQSWEFNARTQPKPDDKIASLQKIDLGTSELLIAFIRCIHEDKNQTVHGWTCPLAKYIIVTDAWPELAYIIPLAHREAIWRQPGFGATVTLVHELGHAFGAFHLDNQNSIMNKLPSKIVPPRIEFDDVSRQVILLARDVDFSHSPDSLSIEAARNIRNLYREHRHPSEPIDADPVTIAYRNLAASALLSGNRTLEKTMADRAANWWREEEAMGNHDRLPTEEPANTGTD